MSEKKFFDNHNCNCVTFLNEKGVLEMEEYNFDDYTENMYVEVLSYKEAESIYMQIFNKINEQFGLLIDFFEEENLSNENLSRAIDIVKNFIELCSVEEQVQAAQKVLRVLQKAVECGTYVCFEF